MRDYVTIQNYSRPGTLGIHRNALVSIAKTTVDSFAGTQLNRRKGFKLYRPVSVTIGKEGKVKVELEVSLKAGSNVSEICLGLQKEVASNLSMMIDTVPYEVKIKVAQIS